MDQLIPLKSKNTENIDALDADVLQRLASAPEASVWVSASAGSGKTKVLTDRILRLLLPQKNGTLGTEPHKILAITFTKAAASEMALRINKRLSEWAVMPLDSDNSLSASLKKLLGEPPTPEQISAAQKLFTKVVDVPGGLKIMTIHSFCQSILGRFPLEANLSPNFKALEEAQAHQFLKQAKDNILKNIEKGSPLSESVYNLAHAQNEDQFLDLLNNLMSERRQFENILVTHFGIDGLYTALCQEFGILAGASAENLIHQACESLSFDEKGLWDCCKALANSTKKGDIENAQIIQKWLEMAPQERVKFYSIYKLVYLKKADEPQIRAKLATVDIIKNNPDVLPVLEKEALRLVELEKNISAVAISILTRDLFLIGEQIIEEYSHLKNNENALDYDDLILNTLDLLQGRTENMAGLKVAPWVRFKLDQGIDHLLVDEAQDTNPEQWEIVKALSDDFFDGTANDAQNRTIFVVGDEKQSIFSFQRASPEKFREMHDWFSQKIKAANKVFRPIDFITSFRSVKSILEVVDKTFETAEVSKGLGLDVIKHKAHRKTQPGLVELWPIFESAEKEKYDPWEPPIKIIDSTSGAAQLANYIGTTVSGWIKNKEILESHDRPIEAGDILILVRSRTAFLDQLVKALKENNVPVSGVDRMVLSEQLVVQDLLATAQFSLLPEDDLTLSGLLKSPFIGWGEEELFKVTYQRTGSVWDKVKKSKDKKVISWLSKLIENGNKEKPYEFFAHLLQEPCPASGESGLKAIKYRLGEECLDPLNEFLNVAINFETDAIIPTLQNFLQNQLYDQAQIKRQMEEGGKAVRIMTVHGAKGLQAPIVIIPDTTRTSSSTKNDRVLWPDRSGGRLPYFCPTSKGLPENCAKALQVLKERQDEEYRRLLYVAMTRAENRLYVAGYKASKNIIHDSWYNYISSAFENLNYVEKIKDDDKIILRYSNPDTQSKPDKTESGKKNQNLKAVQKPDWLFMPMPEEPFPPRPLVPSRPSEQDVAAMSPLQSKSDYRFLRGNITHKLLQILPDLPTEIREAAAQKFVALPAHELSKKIQNSIVSETMKILNDAVFTNIFGKGSMAEVPINGLINNKMLISGQIDRLLITDKEILIVDYKTNRPPPEKIEDVPLIYKNQLKGYGDALSLIYQDRPIRTALIWTDGARLMELPYNP